MQSLRILLAEDEPIIAQDIRCILERDGHSVWPLDDAQDLGSLCDQFAPDLIMLNFKQAGASDGMALAHILRQKTPVPILIVTGAPPKEVSASKAFDIRLPILYKPFTQYQLSRFVEAFCAP